MKIKTIQMKNFRRFTDLTIKALPKTARLVMMIGPNGSGKSSVFDALHKFKYNKGGETFLSVNLYYAKFGLSEEDFKDPKVEFHETDPNTPEAWKKSVHVRSAYRNDLINRFDKPTINVQPITQEHRFYQLAENDQAVVSNYNRLLNRWVEMGSSYENRAKTIGTIQDKIYGELKNAINELFSDQELNLTGLGDVTENKIFKFNKGTSQGFSYEHLSSGEKAALDLLLDIIVFREDFNNTVFCIDEPEAHIHTKLQGPLLEELYKLIPDNSQLWIATHSIGMIRKAQDLWRENPDSVVFLDFGDEKLDFDDEAIITPTSPNPNFWARTYEIALGDLAKLIAPKRIVLCESTEFDADCYNAIFGDNYPDTRFVSIGNCEDVEKADENLIPVIQAVTGGAETRRLRDRDEADEQEIEDNAKEGIRTLSRRNIEGYLLDDEVLTKFCEDHSISDKIEDLLDVKQSALKRSIAKGKAPDDLKDTAQDIHVFIRNAMRPRKIGNKSRSFMKNFLAQLIKPVWLSTIDCTMTSSASNLSK